MSQKSVTILGVKVDSTTKVSVLSWARKIILKKGKAATLFTPNPEMLVTARGDSDFKKILNNSDLNIADGVGLGLPVVRGREVFEQLLKIELPKRKLKVFLLGNSSAVTQKSIEKIRSGDSEVDVKGMAGPQLNLKGETDTKRDASIEKDVVDRINRFKPDILFVAFGAPKQEKWIAKWLPDLDVRLAMGIGGTLNYFSGEKSLPPKWLANLGMEWLWRLTHEKGHLKRVWKAVVMFPLYLALDHILGNTV